MTIDDKLVYESNYVKNSRRCRNIFLLFVFGLLVAATVDYILLSNSYTENDKIIIPNASITKAPTTLFPTASPTIKEFVQNGYECQFSNKLPFENIEENSLIDCESRCLLDNVCKGFNYQTRDYPYICSLYDVTPLQGSLDYEDSVCYFKNQGLNNDILPVDICYNSYSFITGVNSYIDCYYVCDQKDSSCNGFGYSEDLGCAIWISPSEPFEGNTTIDLDCFILDTPRPTSSPSLTPTKSPTLPPTFSWESNFIKTFGLFDFDLSVNTLIDNLNACGLSCDVNNLCYAFTFENDIDACIHYNKINGKQKIISGNIDYDINILSYIKREDNITGYIPISCVSESSNYSQFFGIEIIDDCIEICDLSLSNLAIYFDDINEICFCYNKGLAPEIVSGQDTCFLKQNDDAIHVNTNLALIPVNLGIDFIIPEPNQSCENAVENKTLAYISSVVPLFTSETEYIPFCYVSNNGTYFSWNFLNNILEVDFGAASSSRALFKTEGTYCCGNENGVNVNTLLDDVYTEETFITNFGPPNAVCSNGNSSVLPSNAIQLRLSFEDCQQLCVSDFFCQGFTSYSLNYNPTEKYCDYFSFEGIQNYSNSEQFGLIDSVSEYVSYNQFEYKNTIFRKKIFQNSSTINAVYNQAFNGNQFASLFIENPFSEFVINSQCYLKNSVINKNLLSLTNVQPKQDNLPITQERKLFRFLGEIDIEFGINSDLFYTVIPTNNAEDCGSLCFNDINCNYAAYDSFINECYIWNTPNQKMLAQYTFSGASDIFIVSNYIENYSIYKIGFLPENGVISRSSNVETLEECFVVCSTNGIASPFIVREGDDKPGVATKCECYDVDLIFSNMTFVESSDSENILYKIDLLKSEQLEYLELQTYAPNYNFEIENTFIGANVSINNCQTDNFYRMKENYLSYNFEPNSGYCFLNEMSVSGFQKIANTHKHFMIGKNDTINFYTLFQNVKCESSVSDDGTFVFPSSTLEKCLDSCFSIPNCVGINFVSSLNECITLISGNIAGNNYPNINSKVNENGVDCYLKNRKGNFFLMSPPTNSPTKSPTITPSNLIAFSNTAVTGTFTIPQFTVTQTNPGNFVEYLNNGRFRLNSPAVDYKITYTLTLSTSSASTFTLTPKENASGQDFDPASGFTPLSLSNSGVISNTATINQADISSPTNKQFFFSITGPFDTFQIDIDIEII